MVYKQPPSLLKQFVDWFVFYLWMFVFCRTETSASTTPARQREEPIKRSLARLNFNKWQRGNDSRDHSQHCKRCTHAWAYSFAIIALQNALLKALTTSGHFCWWHIMCILLLISTVMFYIHLLRPCLHPVTLIERNQHTEVSLRWSPPDVATTLFQFRVGEILSWEYRREIFCYGRLLTRHLKLSPWDRSGKSCIGTRECLLK